MRVEVITCMYNEEFLAPFFLKHYEWVDKITVLFGTDSTDRTESILKQNPKVEIIPFTMPAGIDDDTKVRAINDAYWKSDADWVIAADTDEFIFLDRTDLEKIGPEINAARTCLYNVYRNVSEGDLDLSKNIKENRRYGYLHPDYVKPSLVRSGLTVAWSCGHHGIVGAVNYYPKIFLGSHWANADLSYCVERRIKGRRDRQSAENLKNKMGVGNTNITAADIIAECKQHENDKKVFWEGDSRKIIFGCLVNDLARLDSILRQSALPPDILTYTITLADSATKGLNRLLGIAEAEGADICVLTHQDMFYPVTWIEDLTKQLALLPENWVTAGIVGKDKEGVLCGRFHDMSTPLWILSNHKFPIEACCYDECCIIVNMKSGFRFEEELDGWDLYGTYAALRSQEMGSAWIIDAWAEHYCGRFHRGWEPDEVFKESMKWLFRRFPDRRIDSTILGVPKEKDNQSRRRGGDNDDEGEYGKCKGNGFRDSSGGDWIVVPERLYTSAR